MLEVRYKAKYGKMFRDGEVIEHCEQKLKTWAQAEYGIVPSVDNISQFVVIDVYRSLILKTPSYKEFVKFYVDDEEVIFDNDMRSDNIDWQNTSRFWEEALSVICGWSK